MEDDRVKALVKELDEAVPRDGAHVRVGEAAGGETLVEANTLGYLRLGIELLKAAHAARSQAPRVDVELTYLTGYDEPCYVFERNEDVGPRLRHDEPPSPWWGAIVGMAFAFFLIGSFLVGAYKIMGWLGGLLSALLAK